jgi:hypothetical protein
MLEIPACTPERAARAAEGFRRRLYQHAAREAERIRRDVIREIAIELGGGT